MAIDEIVVQPDRAVTMDKITALAKNRGIFSRDRKSTESSLILGILRPLGCIQEQRVKKAWWSKFVHGSKYNVDVMPRNSDGSGDMGSIGGTLERFWTRLSVQSCRSS